MDPLPPDTFDELVGEALDDLPEDIVAALENVVLITEDAHPDEPDLLGLYEGVPRTEREDYGGLELPDRVTIYRLALCGIADDLDDLRHEIAVTVVHEFAHHLGIDDDRLAELGWD